MICIDNLPEDTRISDLKGYEDSFSDIEALVYTKKKNTLKRIKNNYAERLVEDLG